MILYPPVIFDANEWFIIITAIIMWTGLLLLPKRFSILTALLIWLFTFFLCQVVDFIIGKPPLMLYYNNDIVEYEYFDILLYIVGFPPFAYFFSYYLDSWNSNGLRFVGYILSWALFTTSLELVSVRFCHVFTWTGWNALYSFLSYILIYLLIYTVFRFIQHYQKTVE